jgi:hypothetical protein
MAMSNHPLVELMDRNSSDPRNRLEIGQLMLESFAHNTLPSDSAQLNNFCDIMVQWMNGSNYKVCVFHMFDFEIEQHSLRACC